MAIREDDNDINEGNNELNMIIIPINTKDEKYLLKISKGNETINFKLEKEKIQTYYYTENFDLKDFKQKNKLFLSDENIPELFAHLKEMHKNCIINLENRAMKIIINFQSNTDSKFTLNFTLIKKTVSQNELNPLLVEQIQKNRIKIQNIKKQIAKLSKEVQAKEDLINEFNNNISNIETSINNANLNLNKLEEESNSNIKEEEEEEFSKEDNSSVQEKEPEQPQEVKRYISNNRKKKNRKQNKKIKMAQIASINAIEKKMNEQDEFFCFNSADIVGNKKAFEFLILFNLVTIIIIFILLGNIYFIKADLEYQKLLEEDFMNRLAYSNEENDNEDDDDEELNLYKMNKEPNDYKNSLFENENLEFYFKRAISQKVEIKIKDIDFVLKYSSITDPQGFNTFYNNCKGIYDNLILMRNSRGKKFALYSRNLYEILHGHASVNFIEIPNNFVLYRFNTNDILQYSFRNIYEVYQLCTQTISKYFLKERNSHKNKHNDNSNKEQFNGQQIFGKLVDIEIYQIKFTE